jgi:Mn-dependent DtxR family transcriptional regulator
MSRVCSSIRYPHPLGPFLKLVRDQPFLSPEEMYRRTKADPQKREGFFSWLIEEGYVTRDADGRFHLTDRGERLAR